MRRFLRASLLTAFLWPSFFALAQQNGTHDAPHTRSASVAPWPIAFEPNLGQGGGDEAFLAHAGALQAGFAPDTMSVRLPSTAGDMELSIHLAGGNREARIEPTERTTGESNYLLGPSSHWKTHIPHYGRLTYRGVYPGIDLTVYGTDGRIEHDFVVQPGGDYRQIKMRYEGASHLALSREGDLHVSLAQGEITVHAPHIYQPIDGSQREIAGSFVMTAGNEVTFRVEGADPKLPLVIDPVLDYATYVANQILFVNATAVDAAGDTYILGQALSSGYPVTPGAYQSTCKSCSPYNTANLFVTKLNPAGTAQVYSTYLGGTGNDQPYKIAVDPNGNAVVTGTTTSTDFPQKNPIMANTTGGGFITSLAPDGASLNFSTVIGDEFGTFPWAVTTDATGDVYVAGTTNNALVPVTTGTLQAGTPAYPNSYVFLTKLTSTGSVVFGAIPGPIGSASLCCSLAGIALDASGNIYLAGTTGSSNFTAAPAWPTTPGAYQTALPGSGDAASPFVAKIAPDASKFLYSTLVGGGIATSMTVTSDQKAIVAGHYADSNFPVTSDAYSSTAGLSFLSKVNMDGTQLAYSTFFSTPTADTGGDIAAVALDPSGNVWIAGQTNDLYGTNIPLVNPLQSSPGSDIYGSGSAFVSEFDPAMHQLLFSTYFNGASSNSRITGLAMDTSGRAHIVGDAQNDLPTTPSAFLTTVNAANTYNNTNYEFGYAALIDPTTPGPGICFKNSGAGPVAVGASGYASVTITNCGNASLTVSAIQLTSTVFTLTSPGTCVGTLAPSASCVVSVTFTPAIAGAAGARLTVSSNAMVPVYTVGVTGNGTAPTLSLLTPSVVFAPQVFGVPATASQGAVFITNTGSGPLTVSSSTVTGDFSIVRSGCANILPGTSCTITLAFSPTVVGTRTGLLTIASNDPVHPTITVPLTGTSTAAYTQPTITSLSVPSVALGSTSLKLNIYGTNFFPTSTVVIGGEVQPLTGWGSTVLSVSVDPFLLTSMGDLPVTVINPAPGGQSNSVTLLVFRALPLSANGLVYSPVTQLLYASIGSTATVNANTVLPIDPITGISGTPIFVGANPGKLALSSDGAYLYVGINGDHTLERINLSSATIERTFPLPVDSMIGATTVYDMHGVPGSPQSVVVSLRRGASPAEAGAALFNDSGLVSFLGNSYPTYYAIDAFAFTADPTLFYSYPFDNFFGTTSVSASGLNISHYVGGTCCNQISGSLVASDGSLLYTNSGQVWNPTTTTLIGTYSASSPLFYEEAVLPDTANQRTFFLDSSTTYSGRQGYASILGFDQTTFRQAGVLSLSIPEYNFTADLNRWGSDGFAFRSSYDPSLDQVIIVRSSLLHLAAGGTPTLTGLSTTDVLAGSASMQITLTGSGFLPGTMALWNGSPLLTLELNSTQLSALVPAGLLASAGTAQVTAANPGGGTSAPLLFTIDAGPKPSIAFAIPTHTYGDAPFAVLATPTPPGPSRTRSYPVRRRSPALP